MTKIDFNNLGDVSNMSCIDVFEALKSLREKPEEFEKAADALKKAAIMQFGRGRNPKEMEEVLREVDAEVKKPQTNLPEPQRLWSHRFDRQYPALKKLVKPARLLTGEMTL